MGVWDVAEVESELLDLKKCIGKAAIRSGLADTAERIVHEQVVEEMAALIDKTKFVFRQFSDAAKELELKPHFRSSAVKSAYSDSFQQLEKLLLA